MKHMNSIQSPKVKLVATRMVLGAVFLVGLLVGPSLGQAAKVEPNLTKLLGQALEFVTHSYPWKTVQITFYSARLAKGMSSLSATSSTLRQKAYKAVIASRFGLGNRTKAAAKLEPLFAVTC